MKNPDPWTIEYRLSKYSQDLIDILRSSPMPLYYLSDLPGNWGDKLIHRGTEFFLKSTGIEITAVSISGINTFKSTLGTLLVPGSGAFHILFNEWLPDLVLASADKFSQVIVFPSQFSTDVDSVKKVLQRTNVFCIARETRSYNQIKQIAKVGIGLDLALHYFEKRIEYFSEVSDKECLLVALRQDQGSLLSTREFEDLSKLNNDISWTSKDLEDFVNQIQTATLVITDRLHIAVTAVMLGKKLYYFETYDDKIKNYFEYHFGQTNCKQFREINLEELMEIQASRSMENVRPYVN